MASLDHGSAVAHTAIAERTLRKVQDLLRMAFKRVWPKEYPTLKEAFLDFSYVLRDFLEVFTQHVDFEDDDTTVRTIKFYKSDKWLEQDEFRRRVEQFNFQVALVGDLILEMTRAANRVCDEVRCNLEPTFRLRDGVLLASSADGLTTIKDRAEYKDGADRYRGLDEFKVERKWQDSFIGRGSNPEADDDEFNDPALALLTFSRISTMNRRLERADDDIAKLERMLVEAGITIEFWITAPNDDPLDCNEIRQLGWAQFDGGWRLMHHSSHYEFGGSSQRPLAEMPPQTKLKCLFTLPKLLDEIAQLAWGDDLE